MAFFFKIVYPNDNPIAEQKMKPMDEKENSTAWCPDCGDEMVIEQAMLGEGENWHYYCFGCDKLFKFIEVK